MEAAEEEAKEGESFEELQERERRKRDAFRRLDKTTCTLQQERRQREVAITSARRSFSHNEDLLRMIREARSCADRAVQAGDSGALGRALSGLDATLKAVGGEQAPAADAGGDDEDDEDLESVDLESVADLPSDAGRLRAAPLPAATSPALPAVSAEMEDFLGAVAFGGRQAITVARRPLSGSGDPRRASTAPSSSDVAPTIARCSSSPAAGGSSSFAASSFSSFAEGGPSEAWNKNTSRCEVCSSRFGLLNRRHHCRRCCRCVCQKCSPFKMHLDSPVLRANRKGPGDGASFAVPDLPPIAEPDLPATTDRAYVLDNSQLQSPTRGMGWRLSTAGEMDDQTLGPSWGQTVYGTPLGDEWLQVDGRLLPMRMKGVVVLCRAPDAAPIAAAAAARPTQVDRKKAHRVCVQCHLPPAAPSFLGGVGSG